MESRPNTPTLASEPKLSPTPLAYPPAVPGFPAGVPTRKLPTKEKHYLFSSLDEPVRTKLIARLRRVSNRIGRAATVNGLARFLLDAIAHRRMSLPEEVIGREIERKGSGGRKIGAKVPADTFARGITASRDIGARLGMDINVSKLISGSLSAFAKRKLEIDEADFLTFIKGGSKG